ncbi:hypothetical protein PIB30_029532 [Stylosanthes scabra]|uniref:CCHC-type domain-containing protein n=1 Tax=Stylosanthes scabra TaxID=79078 RepID=A0ABU6UBJ8_9FABA|nr:hypothetical protein [Stylosanthes scabra]
MLGKKIPEHDIIVKILRSLSSKWISKVSAIQEGVQYQSGTLTFDQLRGNLLTYEMTILDSQYGEPKKKSLALKALSQYEESHENNDEEDDDDEESEDQIEGFEFLLREFNEFAQRKIKNLKNKSKPPKCYDCGELGHIKPNCHKNQKEKKYKKKNKAYISWENEDANICLMTNEVEHVNDRERIGYDVNKASTSKLSIKRLGNLLDNLELKKLIRVLKTLITTSFDKMALFHLLPNVSKIQALVVNGLSSTLKIGDSGTSQLRLRKSGLDPIIDDIVNSRLANVHQVNDEREFDGVGGRYPFLDVLKLDYGYIDRRNGNLGFDPIYSSNGRWNGFLVFDPALFEAHNAQTNKKEEKKVWNKLEIGPVRESISGTGSSCSFQYPLGFGLALNPNFNLDTGGMVIDTTFSGGGSVVRDCACTPSRLIKGAPSETRLNGKSLVAHEAENLSEETLYCINANAATVVGVVDAQIEIGDADVGCEIEGGNGGLVGNDSCEEELSIETLYHIDEEEVMAKLTREKIEGKKRANLRPKVQQQRKKISCIQGRTLATRKLMVGIKPKLK